MKTVRVATCSALFQGAWSLPPPCGGARYLTMLQPVEEKYGRLVVCLVYLASLCGDIFWTAAILTTHLVRVWCCFLQLQGPH